MQGDLFINGKDAYTEWGITLTTSSLSALMVPPPLKAWITNEVRTESGTRYAITDIPQIAARDINITFNITAKTESILLSRYTSFCRELQNGIVELKTKYQPDITYHLLYKSCSQFTQFIRQIAVIGVQFVEPNPSNR